MSNYSVCVLALLQDYSVYAWAGRVPAAPGERVEDAEGHTSILYASMVFCKCPQAVCLQHLGNVLQMHQDTLATSVCGLKLLATSI